MTTRRLVTGLDGDGRSCVVFDGPTPGSVDIGRVQADDVWVDDPSRPDPGAEGDPVAGDLALMPPVGGSVVRIVRFMPADRSDVPDAARLAVDTARWDTGGVMEGGEAATERWHTTPTIDYGIILSGQVELGLDTGWVRLAAGDVVVQRATRHAWRAIGDEPAAIAFVLISSPNYR